MRPLLDDPRVFNALLKQGIQIYVKVKASAKNAEMMKRYRAKPNTFLLLDSSGETVWHFPNYLTEKYTVMNALFDFKAYHEGWKRNRKNAGTPGLPAGNTALLEKSQ